MKPVLTSDPQTWTLQRSDSTNVGLVQIKLRTETNLGLVQTSDRYIYTE